MDKSQDLVSLFGDMPDPRLDRKRLHDLGDIMAIAIMAVISGAESWVDMEEFGLAHHDWLHTFLSLPNGIPSHDTFNRVFSLIDPKEFEKRFVLWVEGISNKIRGHIAIDGKVIKGSGSKKKAKNPLWMVSAWAADSELILAHTSVADKSNEISAIPKILELLSIEGCVVSIDAMGCQKQVVDQIVSRHADYVLAVKGNQKNLHSELVHFFEQAEEAQFEYISHDWHKSYEEVRGREEERMLYVTGDIDWLPMRDEWQKLRSLLCVITNRTVEGVTSTTRRYYISSLSPDAQEHSKVVRNHWGIENKQHWILDVAFNEDKTTTRDRVAR